MQPNKTPISEEQIKSVEAKIRRSGNFQRIFNGKDGKFVLDEIDRFTLYNGNTFDPDPYKHAYNAGQRSMAVFIHNIIDQDVESARKILKQENENGKTRTM